jgi:hypothetical protein
MHLTIPELAELITPGLHQGGESPAAQRLPKPMKVRGKGLEPYESTFCMQVMSFVFCR